MAATLFRLLSLIALVLMPFTMAPPAMAHAAQGPMLDMSAEHCADHQDENSAPMTDTAQCILMCAALPAAEPQPLASPDLPRPPLVLAGVTPIHGIILEIATPPPRRA